MENIITRILDGDCKPSAGRLDFSVGKIEIKLYPGEEHEGSFHIYGPLGLPTEGFVLTDDLRMEIYTREFAGKESEIAFCFRSPKTNERDSDSHQGEFFIVSNHGEYIVPYQVSFITREIKSSLGPVKNLFHFANLAKTNWGEALNLFYSPAFATLLTGADKQYLTLYRGLSGCDQKRAKYEPKNEHNMEEFLLAIKKKQKIEFIVKEASVNLSVTLEPTEYLLTITRNGWGFSNLYCQPEGDFLVCDKEVIRDEDYLANVYKLSYYVLHEKLHSGNNFGRIRLYNANTEIIIPVTAVKNDTSVTHDGLVRKEVSRANEHKSNIYKLVNAYVAFRTKKTSQSVWRKETEYLIDKMITAADKDLLPKLFRIQLLITENRLNEASRLLTHADSLLAGRESEMPELWCYYLYLTTLENRDPKITSRIAYEVERFYIKDKGNWQIGWLLCYLKEEYVLSPAKKWAFLRELVGYGNYSPVIFVEAWQLLKQKPEFLTRLDNFEIRLLLFSARRSLIPKSLIPQIVYLATKNKNFSEFLYRILEKCYEIVESNEVVQAICELLIKGEKIGPEYFSWYQNGVRRDINVTRLYEFFIFSLNQEKEEEIPKQVLLYFAYNSEIDYRYQAYIYAFVHRNRDLYPDIFESYSGKIERFVLNQLSRARTGKSLAYLYKNYLTAEMINPANASFFADILFTAKIVIFKENIREIIILYHKVNWEITNRISGKESHILLYGTEYQLLLADADGNRYADPTNYRLERWLAPDKIGRAIAPLVKERAGFDIWSLEQGDDLLAVTRSNLSAYERIYMTNNLKPAYRETLCRNLIRFYYDFEEQERLEKVLTTLKAEDINRDYHEEILTIMVASGLYREAYGWLPKTAAEILDPKLILQVLIKIIPDEAPKAEKMMLVLAFKAFKDMKYDEKLLNYLVNFYDGQTERLRDIWLAGKSFALDVFKLSEKLLMQILYSGTFLGEQIDIFHDYVAGGGKGSLIKAFIIHNSYHYFANGKTTDITVIRQIGKLIDNNESLDFVCQLAFVKYFAENKAEIDDDIYRTLIFFMQDLIDQDIYFAFFKEYIGILPLMDQFIDKTMIEYRSHSLHPLSRVLIHYEINDNPMVTEPMTEMYDGVYLKQFLLFYGDTVSYYVTEEEEGAEIIRTESTKISINKAPDAFPGSRFMRINEIEAKRKSEDDEALNALLSDYQRLDFLVDEMFKEIKG
ncbi:MAG: DUF5717 family protein [Lachnospiraceae bacterium]|nr:DUF5717 family protein [Lachnospiraceae bacterium]